MKTYLKARFDVLRKTFSRLTQFENGYHHFETTLSGGRLRVIIRRI